MIIHHSPYPDLLLPENQSLVDFVFQYADRHIDKVAMVDGLTNQTTTYRQLITSIRRFATGLSRRGFKKGDCFGVVLPNSVEFAIAYFGVIQIGGICTTLNPSYSTTEMIHQLRDSGASYVLTVPALLAQVSEAAAKANIAKIHVVGAKSGDNAVSFDELLQDGEPPRVTINAKKDLCALPYSSGTTGLCKGVMLSHYNMVANATQCRCAAGVMLGHDDIILAILPYFHIYGQQVQLISALWCGAKIVVLPRFELERYLSLIQEHKVTKLHVAPPVVLALAKHPLVDKFDLSSVRAIMSGAAPLGGELADAVSSRLKCPTLQGYGMTELSPVTHSNYNAKKPQSVGPALPNTRVRIVDPASGKDMPVDQEGEVWITGPQVMQGYLNNPQATAETIDRDGWLHTGDIGRVDADGFLFITDRLKELIKVSGFQVPPAEIEAILLTHAGIADCAVIGVDDEQQGQVPKAFVVKKDPALTEQTVLDFVSGRVATYKRLKYVEFCEAIPKSPSGKILRRLLRPQKASL